MPGWLCRKGEPSTDEVGIPGLPARDPGGGHPEARTDGLNACLETSLGGGAGLVQDGSEKPLVQLGESHGEPLGGIRIGIEMRFGPARDSGQLAVDFGDVRVHFRNVALCGELLLSGAFLDRRIRGHGHFSSGFESKRAA